jgi:putative membrane protein
MEIKWVSRKLVNVVSVAIPLVVALLLGIRVKFDLGAWTKLLPHLNAVLNSLTAILLIAGKFAIRNNKRETHRKLMTAAFYMGSIFLVTYVLYHFSNQSTHYGGEGLIKYIYYVLLISHITLAAIVVYFVLMAMYFALNGEFEEHKRIVKWGYPIWLYVSITGVIVYLMISPYYTY